MHEFDEAQYGYHSASRSYGHSERLNAAVPRSAPKGSSSGVTHQRIGEINRRDDRRQDHPSDYGRLENPAQTIPSDARRPDFDEQLPRNHKKITMFKGTVREEYDVFIAQLHEYFIQYPRHFSSEKRMVAAGISHFSAANRKKYLQLINRRYTWEESRDFCVERITRSPPASVKRSSFHYGHNQTTYRVRCYAVTEYSSALHKLGLGSCPPMCGQCWSFWTSYVQ